MKTKVAVDTSYRQTVSSLLTFQGFKAKIAVEVSKELKSSNRQRAVEYVLLIDIKCVNQRIGKYFFKILTEVKGLSLLVHGMSSI